MLLSVDIAKKTIGTKQLFDSLRFNVEAKEKLAIIGRNGVGKTTLFRMLTKQDVDFEGHIGYKHGIRIGDTAQEYQPEAGKADESALEYLISHLPDYERLKHTVDTFPDHMGDDMRKIETYTNALDEFSRRGYYSVDTDVLLSLDSYQISEEQAKMPMRLLSGGQKRFVELVRIEHADADIALIDEPTNHMDHIAKAAFIEWLGAAKHAVVVISHDRDVLQNVDRIIEIKDGRGFIFKGNYAAYLKQNAANTSAQMHEYEVSNRQIENLKTKIIQFKRLKEKARDPDTIKQFKRREQQAEEQLAVLEASSEKPSFWVDRESTLTMKRQTAEAYDKYKAKNIRIAAGPQKEGAGELLRVEDIALSYATVPLFTPLSFILSHSDRLRLVGRNGAGKSTLIRAILEAAVGSRSDTWRGGSIFTGRQLRLNIYDQEIAPELLAMTLLEAVEHIYASMEIPLPAAKVMSILGSYLFNPAEDSQLPVSSLSGGQKARLQLIRMFANQPNLLILDEPTNHLDLPSIEELENALNAYHGALLYVSHDSYFAKHIGGKELHLAH